ncbi:adenylate kinase-domain-containing protein [Blastocladiella britannica]|nr:adenylate kinase-domain-containing protein [Blastocladiella britannica]
MGAVYISAPSLLRTAVEKKSSLGTQALQALSRGALAPDRVMLELLQQRLAQSDAQAHGWVLEGFPRTREQATGLARRGILPSHMYVLDASDAALIDRAIAQRIDPVTGKEYDTRTSAAAAAPPDVRARLTAKANLREDAVRDRLAAFRRQLPGIIDALKAVSVNVLVPKNASASGSEVAEAVRRALQVRKAPLAEGNAMGFHRILLVGGEPGVRDSVGHKLEEDGHYLVYGTPFLFSVGLKSSQVTSN